MTFTHILQRGISGIMGTALAGGALLLAALPTAAGDGYKGFVRGDALITAEELKTLIDAYTINGAWQIHAEDTPQ